MRKCACSADSDLKEENDDEHHIMCVSKGVVWMHKRLRY
jgi:hypothetical protein